MMQRAMKILSSNVDTTIVENSLEEGYLYYEIKNRSIYVHSQLLISLHVARLLKPRRSFFDFLCHWYDFVTYVDKRGGSSFS